MLPTPTELSRFTAEIIFSNTLYAADYTLSADLSGMARQVKAGGHIYHPGTWNPAARLAGGGDAGVVRHPGGRPRLG